MLLILGGSDFIMKIDKQSVDWKSLVEESKSYDGTIKSFVS